VSLLGGILWENSLEKVSLGESSLVEKSLGEEPLRDYSMKEESLKVKVKVLSHIVKLGKLIRNRKVSVFQSQLNH
jgi:hypothetical protein